MVRKKKNLLLVNLVCVLVLGCAVSAYAESKFVSAIKKDDLSFVKRMEIFGGNVNMMCRTDNEDY